METKLSNERFLLWFPIYELKTLRLTTILFDTFSPFEIMQMLYPVILLKQPGKK